MTATFETNGNKTTVKFEYTAPTTTVANIVGGAAESLFDSGKGDHGITPGSFPPSFGEEGQRFFADLSNQEKLNLVDEFVKSAIVTLANTHKSKKAQDAARKLEAQQEYEL